VLPVRLDDTALPGLRPTVGYLDARRVGIPGIVDATLKKLDKATAADSSAITRVPRTEAERQQLLLYRPPGWEHLYFAGQLLHELNVIEPRYLDHEIGFALGSQEAISLEDAPEFLRRASAEAERLAGTLDALVAPEVQSRAFGPPGEPGDPERILHLAHRWNGLYEALLDWPARLRGAPLPNEFRGAADILSHFMDTSIENYRDFVGNLVAQFDENFPAIISGEISIEMTIVMAVPDGLVDELAAELERVEREVF
jgi:hypothetical protein